MVSKSALHLDEATKPFTSTESIALLKAFIKQQSANDVREIVQHLKESDKFKEIEAEIQIGDNSVVVYISNGEDGNDSIAIHSNDSIAIYYLSDFTSRKLADPADDSSIASEEINTSSDRYDDSIWNKFISEEVENSIRLEAIEAVGKIGDVSTIPTLLKYINDPQPDIRFKVIESLGRIGDSSVVDRLSSILFDDLEVEVRSAAALALGEIGNSSTMPTLIAAFKKDESMAVKASVAKALGQLQSKSNLAEALSQLRQLFAEIEDTDFSRKEREEYIDKISNNLERFPALRNRFIKAIKTDVSCTKQGDITSNFYLNILAGTVEELTK
jgi:hypothetical protein